MSLQGQDTTASTSSFITALVLNGAIFAAELLLFSILRPQFQHVYAPRTITVVSSKRVDALPSGVFNWVLAVFNSDPAIILRVNGMDAYFFVRFLRMMVRMFLPIWIISWLVLLPVTSVGPNTGQPGKSGLDRFVFGNVVTPDGKSRYAAHLVCVYLFTGWILWNIRYEMSRFIPARQRHLLSPSHAHSVQSRSLLITGIPDKYLSVAALTKLYERLPGGIEKIWLNHDLKELEEIFDRRKAACNRLESAETQYLATAIKLHNENIKEGRKAATEPDMERNQSQGETMVPKAQRPTHRLPWKFIPFSLPFIGEQVDSLDWARTEISETNRILDEGRGQIGLPDPNGEVIEDELATAVLEEKSSEPGSHLPKIRNLNIPADLDRIAGNLFKHKKTRYPPLNSAFITFHEQIAAHLAHNSLAHHDAYRMTGRYLEASPRDIIWSNLGLNPYERKIRQLVGLLLTTALIGLWVFPVIFVGIVSNVKAVCASVSFLAWICGLPSVVVGIISGVLPPVLLAVLTMLLPIVLRIIAQFEGVPKKTEVELLLMTRFFVFQVIHNFLIVSFSSGIIAAIPVLIKNPTSIASTLAANLPLASTFFLTYILLQGLSGTAGGFLQIVGLALYYVKLKLLSSTPRSVYQLKFGTSTVAWGTLFPSITLITTIALGYSIIAPIVNGLACVCFFLFYILYKYLFIWVYEQPKAGETGGLFFTKAIQQVFIGLYVQLVCLTALFLLGQAFPEGALTMVLIAIVVMFQLFIADAFGPLLTDLPLTLANMQTGPAVEERVESPNVGTSTGRYDEKTAMRQRQSPTDPSEVWSPSASTPSNTNHTADTEEKSTDALYGFTQPAATHAQRTIWIPTDSLGLYKEEEAANKAMRIDVSCKDADMDARGVVSVSGPPPDYEE